MVMMMTGVRCGSRRWLCLAVAAAAIASCARAECNTPFIGDGDCDRANNSEECQYDGGDCCSCTCVNTERYTCGDESEFACVDPDADCADDDDITRGNVGCIQTFIGDSICDEKNNIAACDYDGGDCCSCTCSESGDDGSLCGTVRITEPPVSDAEGGFNCQDPDADCQEEGINEDTGCKDGAVGDSFCDEVNNNEGCGYDGGDCCICTCKVSSTQACGDSREYDCIDPSASCAAGQGDGDGDDGSRDDDGDSDSTDDSGDDSGDEGQTGTCTGLGTAGILGGEACCAYGCRHCGGSGCGSRDPGSDEFSGSEACCSGGVADLNRPCSEFEPPCTGSDTTGDGGDDDASSSDASSSDNDVVDVVEVGTKTGFSVAATAHDSRAGRSSDLVGCREDGDGGCEPILTRDGVTSEIESRWSCATKIVEGDAPCEIEFIFDKPQDVVDIEVAFWKGDERTRTLEVMLNGEVTHTHESYSGATYNSLGVEAEGVSTVTLASINLEPDEWISLLEVAIMVNN